MRVPNCCGFRCAADTQFTRKKAAEELTRYHKKGPGPTTKLLRDALTTLGVRSRSLLDVGAGIGALTFEMLERGATRAIAVDASAAYLAAAKEEAERHPQAQSVEFVLGDFVDLEAQIPSADIVTLDRVVCCYPEYRPLLEAALRHARFAIALSYPRDRWFVRVGVWFENAVRRLASNTFRTFVHPVDDMQRLISASHFEVAKQSQTVAWAVVVYTRTNS